MFAFLTLCVVLVGSGSSSIHAMHVRDVRSTTCTDTPDLDCADINRLNSLCTKVPDQASYFCPAYCGLCSNGPTVHPPSTAPTVTTSQTTTFLPTTGSTGHPSSTAPKVSTSQTTTFLPTTFTVTFDQSTATTTGKTTNEYQTSTSTTMGLPTIATTKHPDQSTHTSKAMTTTFHQTSSVTCTDVPRSLVDCPDLDKTMKVCERNDSSAWRFCPRFCGICTPATTATTTTTHRVTTTATTTCTDLPGNIVNCPALDQLLQVCERNDSSAWGFCPRYCKICTSVTSDPTDQLTKSLNAITTKTYRSFTGSTRCTDVPRSLVDCPDLDKTMKICERNDSSAWMFCPLYCGKCTPVTPTPCVDSEFLDCAEMNRTKAICTSWVEINDTLEFCPKYCGLCGGIPTTTTTTTTTIPTTITTTTSTTSTTSNPFCQASYRLIKGSSGTSAPVSMTTSSTDSDVDTQLQIAFEKHDINLDGVVTTEEFKQLWSEMDTDGDGQVSETEYASSSLRMSPEIFLFLDEDEDCLLSLDKILYFFFNFDLNFDRLIVEGEFMEAHSRMYNFIYRGSV